MEYTSRRLKLPSPCEIARILMQQTWQDSVPEDRAIKAIRIRRPEPFAICLHPLSLGRVIVASLTQPGIDSRR
jgi:hypothetical protein